MRITFVLPNLRLYGGIKSTMHMAEALQKLGHDVTVVYPRLPGRDGQPWWKPRKTAVQIVRLIQSIFVKPNWFKFSGTLVAAPYLTERYLPEADILVLTWWADVARFHASNPRFGKVIHFVRSYETWGGPEHLVNNVYALDIPRITNSDTLAKQLPSSSICAIQNGLDDRFFEAHPPRLSSNNVTIGILYRLQDWKRMKDAITVVAAIKQQNEAARFVVFGEPLKSEHKSLLSALGHYEYLQLPSGEKLRQTYQQLDIFLFTSDETEAFGNPPLEAMATGCAVVATRVGAIPDYSRDGESALHCEPRDTAAMTQLVQHLIDHPEIRTRLGSAAQRAAQHYRWSNRAKQFQTVLESLLSNETNLK